MATFSSQSTAPISVSKATKLRHLKLQTFSKIVDLLNFENRWRELAMRIKAPDAVTDLFSAYDISKLEDQWKRNGSPAEELLRHWSTTGKPAQHPTVGDLLTILLNAEMFLVADSISQEIFKVPISATTENLKTEEVLASIKAMQLKAGSADKNKNISHRFQAGVRPKGQVEECFVKDLDHQIVDLCNFRYEYLQQVTRNFCDISVVHGGFKIGEGGFGTVYRAYIQNRWMAIKKLKNEVDPQFFTELQCLRKFKHENLLPLFGFSNNGPYSCLVYLYMENGSLQERLCCLGDSPSLTWQLRLSIACGTARGINHLHIFKSPPLVHRDIKSANVLLDKNFVPKVGDFGLARIGNSGQSSTAAFTSNVLGTSVYMAPEAFHGEVSIKLDTFSYGVVLMELLTSLPPYNPIWEEKDLVSHLEEEFKETKNIIDMLDGRAGNWEHSVAVSLYEISKRCVERRKRDRPTIAEILPDIEKITDVCVN